MEAAAGLQPVAPGLEAACAALEGLTELHSPEQLSPALATVEQACHAITAAAAAASEMQRAHLQAVQLCLARLGKVLQALGAGVGLADVAPLFQDAFWSGAVLPLADSLLYCRRWNEVIQRLGDFGRQLQEVAKTFIRDAVVPALCAVAAKCPPAEALALPGMYSGMLQLGTTAAALVGYQSSQAGELGDRTGLAPYAALNILWHGITRLWSSAPQSVRRQLLDQGMGVSHLLKLLCGFLRQDVDLLAGQQDSNVPRRMQFWLGMINKLAVACPEASSTAWEALLKWQVAARQRLGSLGYVHPACQVAEAELFCKSAKSLAIMLNHISSDNQLKLSVDRLRARISAGHDPGDAQAAAAVPTLLASGDVLECVAVMKPHVQLACVQLLPDVVGALLTPTAAVALAQPEVLQRVAEGMLTFLVAACNAYRPGEEGSVDVWLRAQRQLFLLALQPHPLVTEVLARCWGDLVRLAEPATALQHVMMLRQLLHAAVLASEGPGCPLVEQLTALLTCLLCSITPELCDKLLYSALQAPAVSCTDPAQLTCLSADLCVATLVDTATGNSKRSSAVHAVLQQISGALHEQAGAAEASSYAQLLECVQHGTAYLASTFGCGSGPVAVNKELLHRLAGDLVQACIGAPAAASQCWVAPALRALANLAKLSSAQQLLGAPQQELLLPVLEGLQRQPELAACVAVLAATFGPGSVAPTSLFHAILSEEDPLLQFVAFESYLAFVRKCDPALVHALLPPAMRDPGTGAMAQEHSATAAQHLARRRQGSGELASTLQLRSWAEALQGSAGGAAAKLTASARVRAADAGPATLEGVVSALSAAIDAVEQVVGPYGGSLDASTAAVLRQCSTRLEGLLSVAGV